MDTPIFAQSMVNTSTQELCLTAESIPKGMPTNMLINNAAIASSTVIGRRCIRISVTGNENRKDRPKSP